ncbi:11237_t:CDS:2 [Ambispora leptoticha]|uniref:11237_t:CDS:1 n=1 Tax=Ambispora leptoticha TaxID=144679 RepID=A0A9N8VCY5_9GLOM|nr:11237_t:CDS:2 [Ambispora leptoticha]
MKEDKEKTNGEKKEEKNTLRQKFPFLGFSSLLFLEAFLNLAYNKDIAGAFIHKQ